MRAHAMLVLFIGLTASADPLAATPRPHTGAPALLIASLSWLAAPLRALFPTPEPLLNSAALTRELGWREVTLDVDDHGSALFLELSGRCCFASAVIQYSDGASDSLDLHQARRGSGLYLLQGFDRDRTVRQVTVGVEALSSRAYVGARLTR